jgi:hypothetical protein
MPSVPAALAVLATGMEINRLWPISDFGPRHAGPASGRKGPPAEGPAQNNTSLASKAVAHSSSGGIFTASARIVAAAFDRLCCAPARLVAFGRFPITVKLLYYPHRRGA